MATTTTGAGESDSHLNIFDQLTARRAAAVYLQCEAILNRAVGTDAIHDPIW